MTATASTLHRGRFEQLTSYLQLLATCCQPPPAHKHHDGSTPPPRALPLTQVKNRLDNNKQAVGESHCDGIISTCKELWTDLDAAHSKTNDFSGWGFTPSGANFFDPPAPLDQAAEPHGDDDDEWQAQP
jgi:hypothetical protein